jgi:DNA-binding Lrp family transcriptional regulator
MSVKPVVAYVLIVAEVGREYDIIKEVKKLPGVTDARIVYGEFDLVARIETGDLAVLDETITLMRRIPGITRTATLISS